MEGERFLKHFELPVQLEEIFRGLVQRDCGMLVCTDKEMLEKQNGVMSDVVK